MLADRLGRCFTGSDGRPCTLQLPRSSLQIFRCKLIVVDSLLSADGRSSARGRSRIRVWFAGAPERRRCRPPLRTTRNEGHPSGYGTRRRSALPCPSPPNSPARSPRFRNGAELIRPAAQSGTCWSCQYCYSSCSYEQPDTIGLTPLGFERSLKDLPLTLHKGGRLPHQHRARDWALRV